MTVVHHQGLENKNTFFIKDCQNQTAILPTENCQNKGSNTTGLELSKFSRPSQYTNKNKDLFKFKAIYLSEMESLLMIDIFFRFQLILHEFSCSKTLCSTSQIKQWWMGKHACSSSPEPLRQHTSDLSREQGIIAVLSF